MLSLGFFFLYLCMYVYQLFFPNSLVILIKIHITQKGARHPGRIGHFNQVMMIPLKVIFLCIRLF
jgi:hypothetical protein